MERALGGGLYLLRISPAAFWRTLRKLPPPLCAAKHARVAAFQPLYKCVAWRKYRAAACFPRYIGRVTPLAEDETTLETTATPSLSTPSISYHRASSFSVSALFCLLLPATVCCCACALFAPFSTCHPLRCLYRLHRLCTMPPLSATTTLCTSCLLKLFPLT